MEFLKRPALMEAFVDILLCAVPIWVAVMIGLVIGWSWRPRWTGIVFLGLRSRFRFIWTAPPGLGARRLWLAFTALSAFSLCRRLWSKSSSKDKEEGPAVAGTQSSAALASTAPPVVGVRSIHISKDFALFCFVTVVGIVILINFGLGVFGCAFGMCKCWNWKPHWVRVTFLIHPL